MWLLHIQSSMVKDRKCISNLNRFLHKTSWFLLNRGKQGLWSTESTERQITEHLLFRCWVMSWVSCSVNGPAVGALQVGKVRLQFTDQAGLRISNAKSKCMKWSQNKTSAKRSYRVCAVSPSAMTNEDEERLKVMTEAGSCCPSRPKLLFPCHVAWRYRNSCHKRNNWYKFPQAKDESKKIANF